MYKEIVLGQGRIMVATTVRDGIYGIILADTGVKHPLGPPKTYEPTYQAKDGDVIIWFDTPTSKTDVQEAYVALCSKIPETR